MERSTCPIEGCTRRVKSRGWCNTHYERWRRYGTTDLAFGYEPGLTTEDRMRKVGWTELENGCWEWNGYHGGRYGQLTKSDGIKESVHRLSYEVWVGPIPEGNVVRHKCDFAPCVNPDHLEVGTHADNNRDRVERGRCNPRRKLTPEQVQQIRSHPGSQRQIAREFGLAQASVWAIIHNKVWVI